MRLHFAAAGVLIAASIVTASAAAASPARPDLGARTPDTAIVGLTISLRSPHDRQLRSYAEAVSTPGTNRYRHFLTTTELRQQFGASGSTVRRVTRWAKAAGFHLGAVDATGTRLPLSGTAATARRAFGITLYDSVQDGIRTRSATAVQLPSTIAADIAAVSGLNTQPARPMHLAATAAWRHTHSSCLTMPAKFTSASYCLAHPGRRPSLAVPAPGIVDVSGIRRPRLAGPGLPNGVPVRAAPTLGVCATAWAHPDAAPIRSRRPGQVSVPSCGYRAGQLRAIYGLSSSDDGAGQTIVIVGAFNQESTLADANTAFATTGVNALPADRYQVKTYPVAGGPTAGCDPSSWGLEQALNVQTAHTLAPAAHIVYASAPDCTHLADTLARVIADPDLRGSVVSSSWGYPAEALSNDDLAATDAILARAAVMGTGTYAASGLYGSGTTTGMLLPDLAYPASSPWTTAVGGTTTAVGPGETLLWQTGWASTATGLSGRQDSTTAGTPIIAAAGGGISLRESQPAWQTRNPATMRQVPDLAALADPNTGVLVGTTIDGRYSLGPVGGTSLASTIVTSLAALAQARTGHPTGLLTPLLWHGAPANGHTGLTDVRHVDAAVWTPATAGAAADPAGYLIRVDSAVPSSAPGWDPVTGLGAPARTFLSDVG